MPNQLTQEQLKFVQEKIKPVFEHLQRKKAMELAWALEKRVINLENTDPELYKKTKKIIAQLKWVACPLIKNDQEFLELTEKYFLEGLELDINLTDLVTAKLELQFGVNLMESINDILSALRNNKQRLGINPIQIKRETSPAEPLIKNWLLDFIRSAKTKNPTEMEETDYLFNSPNTKNLSEDEKKTLDKVLTFYDTFKLYADGIAQRESLFRLNVPLKPIPSLPKAAPPASPIAPVPPLNQPPQPPAPSYQPTKPTPPRRDAYQEPVEGTLKTGQTGPRIEGNIVDLKNQQSGKF